MDGFSLVAKWITINEVAGRWCKQRKTVEMRIYKGDLVAYKSGKTWLVHIDSVRNVWGEAIHPESNWR